MNTLVAILRAGGWMPVGLLGAALFVSACSCAADPGIVARDASVLDALADGGDAGVTACTSDASCDDGVYCNGAEVCASGDAAVDARGCAAATTPRCMPTQVCDEASDACLTECEVDADADDDGSDAVSCGGDDCDDAVAGVHPGASELCNAVDDDCDALVDDGFAIGEACEGVGLCGAGTIECSSTTAAGCSTDPGGSADGSMPETCDAEDDDCDGMTDEDFSVGASCTAMGECGPGVLECAPDGTSRCSTGPGGSADASSMELCDMLDQDCDGDPLDGFAVGAACDGAGACGAGAIECAGDGSAHCSTEPGGTADESRPETCDGTDEDCDGAIDDGVAGTGGACDTGGLGVCQVGALACGTAGLECQPRAMPSPEVCDGLDNDCNGMADEGDPGGGAACSVPGMVGICQAGTMRCTSAALSCVPAALPGTVVESCNALDDDCNGTIDDPAVVNGLPCTTAFPGVCMAGRTTCASGTSTCAPLVSPGMQPELCDALDNDCNGMTDEMNPTPACTSQNPSAQFVSSWLCPSGACAIASCQTGHSDIDRAPGNGCECATDAHANACNLAAMTTVPVGGTVNVTGVVDSATGSDFVRISFSVRALGAPFHPRIELVSSAGGQYAMDVLTDCSTTAGCSTVGGANNENGIQVNVWEQNYAGYTAGAGCCSDNTPRVSSVIVRIYRRFGDMPTCAPYAVQATNL